MMSEQDMENINEKEKSDDDLISTESYMKFVTEIRPIRTLIKGKHVFKHVIALSKRNLNGKER